MLTLALGIATNTAIFAIVDELNFKPIANTNVDDVYTLWMSDRSVGRYSDEVQIADYETIRAYPPPGIVAVCAVTFGYGAGQLQIPGRAENALGLSVSGGYANVFRLRAQAGRWISDEDNQGVAGADVAVISDRLWREWFAARPEIAGVATITINRRFHRIVGVAQPGFLGDSVDYWRPMGHPVPLPASSMTLRLRKIQPGVQVSIRTSPGTAPVQIADALTAAISSRVPRPESPGGKVELVEAGRNTVDRLARTGYLILGFAALVFFAACANLGNMLYARTTEREGELAIRLALGATRAAIVRLLLAETVLICAAAATLGLAMAVVALRLFSDAFPALQVNYFQHVTLDLSLDWRTFAFAVGAGAAAAIFVGLASVWRSGRVSLLTRLAASSQAVVARTEGRTLRTLLVSIQITAAVVLLIASDIFIENTGRRFDERLLFDTSHLAAARLELPQEYDESRGPHFFDQLVARVRAFDGVEAAALADALPGGSAPSPRGGFAAFTAEAPPRGVSGLPRRLDGSWIHASPGYVATLGLTLTRGRDLQPTDAAGSLPVVVITESVASGLWPGEDPIGKRIVCCREAHLRTVVGVVSDPVRSSIASPLTRPGNFVILPAAQKFEREMLIVLRSATPLAQIEPLRRAVVSLDESVPVFDAGLVERTQFAGPAAERASRVLAGSLGAIALAIAVLGVYAVVSYFVSRRRREFGLRLALGATRGQVVKLVVDYAIHMVLVGLLPGVLLASLGTRVFEAELTRLRMFGPDGRLTAWSSLTVWVAVPLLMLVAGVLAAYIPARRAATSSRAAPSRTCNCADPQWPRSARRRASLLQAFDEEQVRVRDAVAVHVRAAISGHHQLADAAHADRFRQRGHEPDRRARAGGQIDTRHLHGVPGSRAPDQQPAAVRREANHAVGRFEKLHGLGSRRRRQQWERACAADPDRARGCGCRPASARCRSRLQGSPATARRRRSTAATRVTAGPA